jgi:hypothetical protein
MSDVHHLTYKRLGHEKLKDLQALCWHCHKFVHGRSDYDPCAVPSWRRFINRRILRPMNNRTAHSPRSVPCPRCGAPAGQPCRGGIGRGNHHGARIAAARGTESAAEREHKLRVGREWLRP